MLYAPTAKQALQNLDMENSEISTRALTIHTANTNPVCVQSVVKGFSMKAQTLVSLQCTTFVRTRVAHSRVRNAQAARMGTLQKEGADIRNSQVAVIIQLAGTQDQFRNNRDSDICVWSRAYRKKRALQVFHF